MTKTYEVTICPKRPAYNDTGSIIEVTAKNKTKAISEARKQNARHCFYDRHDGPLTYRAREALS